MIAKADISSRALTIGYNSAVYDGKAKEPSVALPGLVKGTHYTVSYTDNINVGTAKVIVEGIGNYSGTITKTFTITKPECPHDWKSATCTIPKTCKICGETSGTATGHDKVTVPGKTATCETIGLTEGQKCAACGEIFVAQMEIAKKAHQAVVIQGKAPTCKANGLTSGSKCKVCDEVLIPQETILATGHTEVIVPGKAATCTTTGLTDGKKCSICGEIITAQTSIPKKEHTASVTISPATESQDGDVTTKCAECQELLNVTKINKIGTVKLKSSSFVYNGKIKNPKIDIKDRNGTIISADNYTVKKPSGRKNVGKYTYTIEFKGYYAGTKKLILTINPKSAVMKKPASIKKGFTVKWNKVSKQATGYEIMYAVNKKFSFGKETVAVRNYKTTSKRITGLKSKKTYYVKMRTYKTVNGKKYYSTWSSIKQVKTK